MDFSKFAPKGFDLIPLKDNPEPEPEPEAKPLVDPVAEALAAVETSPKEPEPDISTVVTNTEGRLNDATVKLEVLPEVIPAWALDLKSKLVKLEEAENGRQRERQETERKAKRTERRSIFDSARGEAERQARRAKRRGSNLFRD